MPNEHALLGRLRAQLEVESMQALVGRPPLPKNWVSRVVDAYVDWSSSVSAPPMKRLDGVGHVRPVIATSVVSSLDEVRAATRSLLLCDSVALLLPDSFNYVGRLLRLATLLEKEIDAGLVHVLPDSIIKNGRYFEAEIGQIQPPAVKLAAVERELHARRVVHGMEVALALDACAAFPDDLDLALTHPHQKDDLARLVDKVRRPDVHILQSADNLRLLPELLTVPIPSLRLDVKDLIAVRRDGLFDAWQSAFRRGLLEIERMHNEELFDPNSAN